MAMQDHINSELSWMKIRGSISTKFLFLVALRTDLQKEAAAMGITNSGQSAVNSLKIWIASVITKY